MAAFDVYLHDNKAGVMTFDRLGKLTFNYAPDYIAAGAPPISMKLPVAETQYQDPLVFPFLENLFPEGQVREQIALNLNTATNNFEKFVRILGGEVAGALSMFPQGEVPPSCDSEPGAALTLETLSQLLLDIADKPFLAQEQEPSKGLRLSLAGAQNKLPIVRCGDKFYKTGNMPSTHIIKPPPVKKKYQTMVYNEFVCMRAAKAAGLNVANVELTPVIIDDDIEYDALVIERYDRQLQNRSVIRLHQEDACQLHSITSSYKYQEDGGPGFKQLFSLIRTLGKTPAKDVLELLNRVLFNMIIGNNDMHNKNYSFLHDDGKLRLSPAYDLISTQLYPDISHNMAMFIEGQKEFHHIRAHHFEAFAHSIGVKLNASMRKKLNAFCDAALESFLQQVANCEAHCYVEDFAVIQRLDKIAKINHAHLTQVLKN